MRTAALILVMLLTGCATKPPQEWRHAHGDPTQFQKDKTECEYEAVKAAGSYAPNNPGYRTELGRAMADSMDTRGRKIEIAEHCMKARGYIQQAVTAR